MLLSKANRIIRNNKGLVISSILVILTSVILVSEERFLSDLRPIPDSGVRARIWRNPVTGVSYLMVSTVEFYSSSGWVIVTSRYWIGNTLYVKMIGIEEPTGGVLTALLPAGFRVSLEGLSDGFFTVVLFKNGGFFNVEVERYELLNDEGRFSIRTIEPVNPAIYLANLLNFAPWVLLYASLISFMLFLSKMILKKVTFTKTGNVTGENDK